MHIITGLNTGGAETMLCRLLERSGGARHRVVSLLQGGNLKRRLLETGITVDEIGMRSGRLSVSGAMAVARIVQAARPDVLQGWMYHGNAAATLAHLSTLRRTPLLWSVHHALHDTARQKPLTRRLVATGARLSRLTSAVIYCSQASAKQHEAIGYDPERTVVIPNGTDCELFRPQTGARERLTSELGIDAAVPVIGLVAGWRPMKDHRNLLQAASLLKERAAFRLVLVGPGIGDGNVELAGLIERGGLGPHVSLLGERQDIPDLLSGFDVFVLPSTSEAFPLVLGEAMASGVPCVATDVGDSSWIIGDAGTVVPPHDPAALAEALEQMVEIGADGRRQLGERARARIVRDFSLDDVVGRYERLYQQVGPPLTKSLALGR